MGTIRQLFVTIQTIANNALASDHRTVRGRQHKSDRRIRKESRWLEKGKVAKLYGKSQRRHHPVPSC